MEEGKRVYFTKNGSLYFCILSAECKYGFYPMYEIIKGKAIKLKEACTEDVYYNEGYVRISWHPEHVTLDYAYIFDNKEYIALLESYFI